MLDPTSGYPFIHWLQQFHSPALDMLFVFATWLGTEPFYWLFLPLLYWLGDRRTAFRVLAVLFVSIFVNDVAKHLFDLPRPAPDQVRVLFQESGTGPGFPSGHAQHAVVLWGALALEARRWWALPAAVVLIGLISLSRIYLGLHFPLDVVGGLVVGGVVLAAYAWLRRRLRAFAPNALRDAVLAAALPLGLLAVAPAMGVTDLATPAKVIGFLAGAGVGYVAAREGGMLAGGSPGWRAAAKVLLGFALVLGLAEGSDLFVPETLPAQVARYAAVGLAAAWLVPWLARRVGLETARARGWVLARR